MTLCDKKPHRSSSTTNSITKRKMRCRCMIEPSGCFMFVPTKIAHFDIVSQQHQSIEQIRAQSRTIPNASALDPSSRSYIRRRSHQLIHSHSTTTTTTTTRRTRAHTRVVWLVKDDDKTLVICILFLPFLLVYHVNLHPPHTHSLRDSQQYL
jgi:hypothetical protein